MLRSKSPVGNPQLIQFSREVIDLLKNQCIMPVTKFIPNYHHHFAKQCRVSDYGYTKLMELLEAVPHVLQVSVCGFFFFCSTYVCCIVGYRWMTAGHIQAFALLV